jgi:PKD repeat protein
MQASPFRWQGTGQLNSTSYISDTFRTVFFAWPVGGIANLADRSEVLWRVIDWLGSCGCSQPVEGAGFGWTPLTPTVNLPVTFTGTPLTSTVGQTVTFGASAEGTPPISFAWAFGDGMIGMGQVVTHSYGMAGTYAVTLTATNCVTGTQTIVHAVIVVPRMHHIYLPLVLRGW